LRTNIPERAIPVRFGIFVSLGGFVSILYAAGAIALKNWPNREKSGAIKAFSEWKNSVETYKGEGREGERREGIRSGKRAKRENKTLE